MPKIQFPLMQLMSIDNGADILCIKLKFGEAKEWEKCVRKNGNKFLVDNYDRLKDIVRRNPRRVTNTFSGCGINSMVYMCLDEEKKKTVEKVVYIKAMNGEQKKRFTL